MYVLIDVIVLVQLKFLKLLYGVKIRHASPKAFEILLFARNKISKKLQVLEWEQAKWKERVLISYS
jgi:hypothetical protein